MRKFVFGIILIVVMLEVSSLYWKDDGKQHAPMVDSKKTFSKVEDTEGDDGDCYYSESDAVWLRGMLESSPKAAWNICQDQYTIEYPEFMVKGEDRGDDYMQVLYREIKMEAYVFLDEYDMSVQEKFKAVNLSAVTASVVDSSFMMAGRLGDNMRYFEKYILLEHRKWMYLRVEVPKQLTWAADPLLHYVKDYRPYKVSQALRRIEE